MTNFTTSNTRAKILSASNFIKNIGEIIISFLCGLLLEFYTTSQSYFIVRSSGAYCYFSCIKIYEKKNWN